VVVDSSGWLEYITEEAKASQFAPYIEREQSLLLPTIVIYEVFKKLRAARGQPMAERFLSQALRTHAVGLDENLALAAALASLAHGLAKADAIIYATARTYNAQLVTSDIHFKGLLGVTLI
jgi:predicted nucleic acid-binding protein